MPETDISAVIFSICKDGARVHQLRFARERLEDVLGDMRRYEAPKDWIEKVDYALRQVRAAQ